MALNDIIISQLPPMVDTDITDDTLFTTVKESLNFKVRWGVIKTAIMDVFYTDRPLGEMSLSVLEATQIFTQPTYEKITVFDKIQYERGVDIDVATDKVTILEAGNYKLGLTFNGEFATAQAINLAVLVNGEAVNYGGSIQGRGAGKPVFLSSSDTDPLNEGDVITVGAKDEDSGTLDVKFKKVRLSVERV